MVKKIVRKMSDNFKHNTLIKIFSYVNNDYQEILEKVSLVPSFTENLIQYPSKTHCYQIIAKIKQKKESNTPDINFNEFSKPYVQEWIKRLMFKLKLKSMSYHCLKYYSKKIDVLLDVIPNVDEKNYYRPFFKEINPHVFKFIKLNRKYSPYTEFTGYLMRNRIEPNYFIDEFRLKDYNFSDTDFENMRIGFFNYCTDEKNKIFDLYTKKAEFLCTKKTIFKKFTYANVIHSLLTSDISIKDKNRNVLHLCSLFSYYPDRIFDQLDFSKFLNENDYKGYTPLHYAILSGDLDAIIYLIKKGSKFFEKPNSKTKSPYSLLMSVMKQNSECPKGKKRKLIIKKLMVIKNIEITKKYSATKILDEYYFDNFGCKKFYTNKKNNGQHVKKIRSYLFNDNIQHPIDYNLLFTPTKTIEKSKKSEKIYNNLVKFFSFQ